MFTLTFLDAAVPRAHQLRDGETIIGRAPTCDLVITAPLMSRQHARIRLANGKVFVRDAGSTYGTMHNGVPIATEVELAPGESFSVADVVLTLEKDVTEDQVLTDDHQLLEESATIFKPIGDSAALTWRDAPPVAVAAQATPAPGAVLAASASGAAPTISPVPAVASPSTGVAVPTTGSAPGAAERRSGEDRRSTDFGRTAGNRRGGRDRRESGRFRRLLADVASMLVAVQALEQVLARVVDLVFDVLPAERTFLLLRDSIDEPLTARVMRNRDGSVPTKATISRTVVHRVMRERVAMLAKDAVYDARLDAAGSIQAMNIRSFMCAPLWNRNEVIGVLYCDNPRSRKFTGVDLEVFVALCNYAAVAIEQSRLSVQLLEETRRRERLQRYHSPGVVNRILHAGNADGAFVAQTRDVTVMFCDIVGFTAICQHAEPSTVGDLLNDFFARMGDVIFEHDGTLDKFIGDAILAVFGAPFEQPDHAVKAVVASLAMRRELVRINAGRNGDPIRMRIAINSGLALTGDIGSPRRREFTVLGDVVNTAARLESSVASPDQIVISGHTRDRLGSAFNVRSLGGVTLRGRDAELEVFEVID